MLLEARGTFDLLKKAKPTAKLAYAIRDDAPFERLGEEEIEALCRFNHELRKVSVAGAKAAQPEPVAPQPVPEVLKPEVVEAAKTSDRRAKKSAENGG
jgi:hypothetical protein